MSRFTASLLSLTILVLANCLSPSQAHAGNGGSHQRSAKKHVAQTHTIKVFVPTTIGLKYVSPTWNTRTFHSFYSAKSFHNQLNHLGFETHLQTNPITGQHVVHYRLLMPRVIRFHAH